VNVLVVGGGVIGLASAHFLRAGGAEVTLVERDRFGAATSSGNGGWISPVLSAPLPGPHALGEALRSMANPNGAVGVAGRPSAQLARWLVRFARACGHARAHEGLLAMLGLSAVTPEALARLRAAGADYEEHHCGMTFAFRSRPLLEAYAGMLCPLPSLGYRGEVHVLSAEDALAREPLLSNSIVGAIHTTAERHVRPESLCGALVHLLTQGGVKLHEHDAVERFGRSSAGRWWAAMSSGERHEADAIVIAAGAASVAMLATLGVRLLVQNARGHSLTTPCEAAPTSAVYLADRRVGVSPFRGHLRLAGLFEVGARETRVRPRRIETLRRAAAEFLPAWRASGQEVAWAGLRTVAPDGLPVIGRLPAHAGAYVVTAHGMMGVTLAAATGSLLASLVLEETEPPEFVPFRPDRAAVVA